MIWFLVRKETRVLNAIQNNARFALDIGKEARVGIGSLYPILARLESNKTITSDWAWDEDNIRRRAYYIAKESE